MLRPLELAGLLALALGAGATGFILRGAMDARRAAPVIERPAPEVRLDGGALVLARLDALPPNEAPLPDVKTPGIIERRERFHVSGGTRTPPLDAGGDVLAVLAASPCPDVTVDAALVRGEDGTARLEASSPSGVILGGFDIPLAPSPALNTSPAHLNALGVAGQVPGPAVGLFFEHDFSRLRVGGDLLYRQEQLSQPGGLIVGARLGWVW